MKLLKKLFSPLLELFNIKLFLTRYIVNFIVFIEIIFLPILLQPNFYVEVELFKQILLSVPLILMGSYSGYLVLYYNQNLNYEEKLLNSNFIIAILTSIICYLIFNNLIISLSIFIFLPVFAIEKILVAKNKLILASIYKSFISIVLLGFSIFIIFFPNDIPAITIYAWSTFIGIFLWLIIVHLKTNLFHRIFRKFSLKETFKYFFEMAKVGFLINIQTYILLCYFISDRIFINNYYSLKSSEYAISFSLSQIIFIGINTVAFEAQRKIGINLSNINNKKYQQLTNLTFLLFFLLLIPGLIFVLLFNFFIKSYGDFYLSFIIISVFTGGFLCNEITGCFRVL